MDILQAKHLTKRFGNITAVDDISFSLREGEILGLLGPNGAGKTTTLQMLLGILTPTSGEVFYFGKPFSMHREEVMEYVNFSSTYTNLPWDLTVKENLTFFSFLYSIKNRKARIEKIVDIFRLPDLLNKRVIELSTGQLTRLNLAKAFINFPKIVLLDEPTASLDPEVAQYIRQFLLEERKEFQVSIILTSHNMSEVTQICDRVIFIGKGKMIADDTPENLARSVEVAHVELLIKDGVEKAVDYCKTHKISCIAERKRIRADIQEQKIPSFLQGLMAMGIDYSEISIAKPTLEDYFLQTVHKNLEEKL